MSESSTPEHAASIHSSILALDAHLDIEVTFFTSEQSEASGFQKLASLEKIEEGGLRAAFFLGENGGVIHIVGLRRAIKADSRKKTQEIADLRVEFGLPVDFWPFFLAVQERDAETRIAGEQQVEEIEEKHGRPIVRDLVDHADHVVNRIGIDHVGLSSDFYNCSFSLDGWRDDGETRNVTLDELQRGYAAGDIGKIRSGNALRIWREVEEVAAELQR